MKCLCCGSERQERKACTYCGFKPPIVVGDEAASALNDLVLEYRKSLLARITRIYVQPFAYQLSEDGISMAPEANEIVVADGADRCDNEPAWAKELFAQNPNLAAKRTLKVYYVMDAENKKPVTVTFAAKSLKHTSEFWRVGVAIDEHLRLVVYIGDPKAKKWATSAPADLNLI